MCPPSSLFCAHPSLLQADEGKAREKVATEARAAAEQATKEAEESAAQVGRVVSIAQSSSGSRCKHCTAKINLKPPLPNGHFAPDALHPRPVLPSTSASAPALQRAAKIEEVQAALKAKEEEVKKLDTQHGADLHK